MRSPNLHILVSENGVEEVDIIYAPRQELDAWRLCQDYLPLLLAKTSSSRQSAIEAVDSASAPNENTQEGE
jgi:hypothetical protein